MYQTLDKSVQSISSLDKHSNKTTNRRQLLQRQEAFFLGRGGFLEGFVFLDKSDGFFQISTVVSGDEIRFLSHEPGFSHGGIAGELVDFEDWKVGHKEGEGLRMGY